MSMFWFEAQTGLVRDVSNEPQSNYYNYRLPEHARETVERAVNAARLESGGFSYPKTFLAAISKLDEQYRRHGGTS